MAKNIRDAIGELLWFEVKTIGNEKADKIANTILTLLREEVEAKKGEGGLRLNTFKEGYKSGYNKALDDILALLK